MLALVPLAFVIIFTTWIVLILVTRYVSVASLAAALLVPVLTIALDTGFQSIGPFNRAFKAHTGLTPTEYRKQAESRNGAPI